MESITTLADITVRRLNISRVFFFI